MTDIFTDLFSFDMVAFCLAIFALVWIFRKGVELTFPKIINIIYWRELIIPSAPLILGGVGAALLSKYPYPETFGASAGSRAVFGICAGFISGWVYQIIKKIFLDKLGVSDPDKNKDTVADSKSDKDTPPTT